ncbi:MAG TPA: NEW3 domain-containing protein [Dehalococcoidales bacterium]|nr:NEW3 domain-containing protein [Dehalococcoidales bacterium]
MKKMRFISLITVMVILLAALWLPVAVFADDSTSGNTTTTTTPPTPSDSIVLTTDYPTLEAVAAGSLSFNVNMDYTGGVDRVFDLKTSAPSGWDVYIEPQYETGKKISSLTIQSSYSGTSKQITAVITAPTYPVPDPGSYKVLLTATSGNVTGSIELVSKITAKYALTSTPANQLYNTSALAGKNNVYSVTLNNIGTATLTNITFSSTHPDGWEITFSPKNLETLKTNETQTVDVTIKPAAKTVAGDYMINLQVSGKEASATAMDVRVTVKTPTIWGWVGVILIVVVVAGLFVIIMRFGRR